MVRNAIGLSFDPPRYLEVLLVPFPDTTIELAFAFRLASVESLELRRRPESENNLPEIWNDIYLKKKKRNGEKRDNIKSSNL